MDSDGAATWSCEPSVEPSSKTPNSTGSEGALPNAEDKAGTSERRRRRRRPVTRVGRGPETDCRWISRGARVRRGAAAKQRTVKRRREQTLGRRRRGLADVRHRATEGGNVAVVECRRSAESWHMWRGTWRCVGGGALPSSAHSPSWFALSTARDAGDGIARP